MSWSNVKLILAREIRDQLRDRRTLFMIAVLPLLLYPLLGISFFQVAQFLREHPTKVLLLGAGELERLEGLPRLIEENRFARDWFADSDKADLLELALSERSAASRSSDPGDAGLLEQARQAVQQGQYHVVVYFPSDFAGRLESFRRRLVQRPEADQYDSAGEVPSPRIFYNTASEKSQIAYVRVARVMDRWTAAIGQQNLRDSKVPLQAAKPFDLEMSDVAGSRHRDAAVWSKILPFVLLIWALTGAFYPAIDLCAGEKERGTLETLLSSPAERSEIVWGKLLTVMLFSMTTAALNLLSMGLTGAFVLAQLNGMNLVGVQGQLGLPPLVSLAWLAVALVPISALFSALCLALAAFARSTKEGQYYLMPLVLVTMPLMILPMAPGVELTLGNALIPVSGLVLLLRAMLEGNYAQALPFVPPVVAVTLACCLLAIRWAIDQFNKESVLFRESERWDLGLWIRHLVRDRGPTPTISEAFSCFLLILLVQFFMNLALREPVGVGGIIERIFISQVVVIALPALLMTIMLTRSPRATLLLDCAPKLLTIPVALALAVTLHPLVQSLGIVVQTLYPISPEVAEQAGAFLGQLMDHRYVWLPYLLIALLPAVCEEVAFRGFILSGLRHIGHKWWAIALSAIFFGMAHMMLQQSIMAALTGVVIGYLAVQTGSLLPCIVFHAAHNSLGLLASRIDVPPSVYERMPALDYFLIPQTADGAVTHYQYGWPLILLGTVASAYLLLWLQRLPYRKTQEEQLQEALEHQQAAWEVS